MRNNRGFTLLEIVIAVAIIAFFVILPLEKKRLLALTQPVYRLSRLLGLIP